MNLRGFNGLREVWSQEVSRSYEDIQGFLDES